MAYVYRGTIRDLEAPTLVIIPAPEPKPKKITTGCGDAYGTTAGYKRHQKADEETCPACKSAVARYAKEYRARIRAGEHHVSKGFTADRCGSYAGYVHHLRHHVSTCAPCRKACAEYMAGWRNRRKLAAA